LSIAEKPPLAVAPVSAFGVLAGRSAEFEPLVIGAVAVPVTPWELLVPWVALDALRAGRRRRRVAVLRVGGGLARGLREDDRVGIRRRLRGQGHGKGGGHRDGNGCLQVHGFAGLHKGWKAGSASSDPARNSRAVIR
jgi:hypothetical protein